MAIENLITDHLDLWAAAVRPKSSAGRGSNSKLELTGIKKLRELILELAVRGKLVPQDPSDEPASVLLERIAAEKAQLVKEGKIKKPKALPEFGWEDKPFELPEGWEWACIGYVGNIFNGNSVNAKVKEEKYTCITEGYPFIATKDVGYGFDKLDYENGVTIPFDEANFKVAHQNAVLICAEGGSAGKKCGITDQDICFGNKLFAIELFSNFEPKLLLATYLTPTFFSNFSAAMTGIIGGISVNKFSELLIPIPPLAEQHRIVAKVDELMALCDQLELRSESQLAAHQTLVETLLTTLTDSADADELSQNWARLSTHFDTLFTTEASIDALKQTILQLAVMGKLVPQDPSDEPASALLERIAAEKAQLVKEKKIKKEKQLPAISENEKPFELPQGWACCRISDLGYDLGGGTPSKTKSKYWNGNIPWVSPKDMKVDFISSSTDYVTEDAISETVIKLIPSNSLLMVVRGMILAHSFPVALTMAPVAINQDMKALVFSEINEVYLLTLMKAARERVVSMVEHSSHGTCKLVSEKLWSMVVCIPPKEEREFNFEVRHSPMPPDGTLRIP
ncbi:restriction endonuclease subunit S [Aeromonas veronii]|uniref:restriction endonuclease subunit S n=1 Tax=Aeromonas veronii TaxID=654 RepID=UPI003005D636